MIRALYTAASGMTAQQQNVDTVSNNLANVNTAGYKKESTNFKSLLYANIAMPNDPNAAALPTAVQVGHGVRALTNSRDYTSGNLLTTQNDTDVALIGDGFFAIDTGDEVLYTRDGSFRFSRIADDNAYALVTSDGYPVLSTEDESIVVGDDVAIDKITIGEDGNVFYIDNDGVKMDLGQIQIVQFANRQGLEATGSNLYRQTAASGEAMLEAENEELTKTTMRTGYLEGSNVQVAEEMVNLIIAQRAYELNSKAIQTADSMLQQANELKR